MTDDVGAKIDHVLRNVPYWVLRKVGRDEWIVMIPTAEGAMVKWVDKVEHAARFYDKLDEDSRKFAAQGAATIWEKIVP